MVNNTELRRMISKAGLDAFVDEIVASTQWSIRLKTQRVADEAEIELGATKFGGAPDVPLEFVWPEWNGVPLTFMAQIRLSDIAAYDVEQALPPSGHLYFFYEADSQPSEVDRAQRDFFRVIYIDHEAHQLMRYPHPVAPGTYGNIKAFYPCIVAISAELTLPALHAEQLLNPSYYSELYPLELPAALTMSDSEIDRYFKLSAKIAGSGPWHRLLGHSDPQQADMRWQCQFVTNGVYHDKARQNDFKPGIPDWRLLLLIDTDDGKEGFGGIWGDVGMLYYWIRKQDLAARNFTNCWMIMQCG